MIEDQLGRCVASWYKGATGVTGAAKLSGGANQETWTFDIVHPSGNVGAILRRAPPLTQDYAPYFRELEIKRIPLGSGDYHAILGRGFNYQAYRAGVLADIRDRYYRIPQWLPAGRCYFFERYFPR